MPARIHEVTFERMQDAAAFLAAVSRQAASPNAPPCDAPLVAVELLAPGARVYLNDDVLVVAEAVFGPVPRVSHDGNLAPAKRVVIDIGQPLGMESIVHRLSSHYHGLARNGVA